MNRYDYGYPNPDDLKNPEISAALERDMAMERKLRKVKPLLKHMVDGPVMVADLPTKAAINALDQAIAEGMVEDVPSDEVPHSKGLRWIRLTETGRQAREAAMKL